IGYKFRGLHKRCNNHTTTFAIDTRPVAVHVVSTRYPCQRRLVSPMIGTHADSLGTVTGSVGTYASRSAGLYPCPRSACRGVRGHRPPPVGTVADGLPELFAAALQ